VTSPTGLPEFTTRSKTPDSTAELEEALPHYRFVLDGVEMEARRPKEALVAELAPVQSRRTPPMQKVKLALNFLDDCLLEPGKSVMRARLTDPDDDLDVEDVLPILGAIGDHWKANASAIRR